MDSLPAGFGLICGGFFFLVTLVIGAGLVLFSLRTRKKAESSQSWPSVPGLVIVSTIRESTSRDEDGYTSTYYHPKVEFEYVVGGETYTGKHISFGGSSGYGNPGQARAKLENYPVGAAVVVYYNPEKPAEAVLERKAGGFKIGMIIGIVLLAISACMGCVAIVGLASNFV